MSAIDHLAVACFNAAADFEFRAHRRDLVDPLREAGGKLLILEAEAAALRDLIRVCAKSPLAQEACQLFVEQNAYESGNISKDAESGIQKCSTPQCKAGKRTT